MDKFENEQPKPPSETNAPSPVNQSDPAQVAHREMYRALIKEITDNGVAFFTEQNVGIGAFLNGEEGAYTPSSTKYGGADAIEVLRTPRSGGILPGLAEPFRSNFIDQIVDSSADPLGELLVVAHEYGHHKSRIEGNRSELYQSAILIHSRQWRECLNDGQKISIMEEEVRAWEHARVILVAFGFDSWPEFELKIQRSLDVYRMLLNGV